MRGLLLLATLLVTPAAHAATLASTDRVHPMHTAVVEIRYQPVEGVATIHIRVFRDDLGVAVDSVIAHYVRSAFQITDRSGRTLPLHWEGREQSGDIIVLRLTAPAPEGLEGSRISSTILCEKFEDQVNIVRASYAGRSTTLLFTRGDRAKALP
jgi:hypothetical protein